MATVALDCILLGSPEGQLVIRFASGDEMPKMLLEENGRVNQTEHR